MDVRKSNHFQRIDIEAENNQSIASHAVESETGGQKKRVNVKCFINLRGLMQRPVSYFSR